MYSCKPKKVATMSLSRYKALKVLAMQQKKYDVYADNAVFKNPVGTTQGSSSIEAQFDGMTNVGFPFQYRHRSIIIISVIRAYRRS